MPVALLRANHVPLDNTVVSVHQVVLRILQLIVLLAPMPVALRPFVSHVKMALTVMLVRPVVCILQLLVLLAPIPVVQQRAKHAPEVLTTLEALWHMNHKRCLVLSVPSVLSACTGRLLVLR